MKTYDVAVIGAGPGGYVAAIRAATRGASVAIIEKNKLGGCCLNVGCIPTKAILHISGLVESLEELNGYAEKPAEVTIDYKKVKKFKDKSVTRLNKGVGFLMKSNKIDVYEGTGSFIDGKNIRIDTGDEKIQIEYKNAIIATGGEPIVPPVFNNDKCDILTSTGILDLEELPGSLAVVGGGYIGCEFANAFAALGVDVTVIEMLPTILPAMDQDISAEFSKVFKKKGINVLTSSEVTGVEKKKKKNVLTIKDGDDLEVDMVLVAIGRKPYAEGLNLDAVGVKTNERGVIEIDEYCRTSKPGIYAIGDATGKILLAHAASAQAKIAAENATGADKKMNYSVVPAALFTEPEISCVGLTEQQAKEQGLEFKTVTFSYRALGRAVAADAMDGFVKIIYSPQAENILGAHIIGERASDLIAPVALCMTMEGTLENLADTIFVHPTFSESIMEAAEIGIGQGIHGA